MKLKHWCSIFHVIFNANSIMKHVIQIADEIVKHINVSQIIACAKKIIAGILAHIFAGMTCI